MTICPGNKEYSFSTERNSNFTREPSEDSSCNSCLSEESQHTRPIICPFCSSSSSCSSSSFNSLNLFFNKATLSSMRSLMNNVEWGEEEEVWIFKVISFSAFDDDDDLKEEPSNIVFTNSDDDVFFFALRYDPGVFISTENADGKFILLLFSVVSLNGVLRRGSSSAAETSFTSIFPSTSSSCISKCSPIVINLAFFCACFSNLLSFFFFWFFDFEPTTPARVISSFCTKITSFKIYSRKLSMFSAFGIDFTSSLMFALFDANASHAMTNFDGFVEVSSSSLSEEASRR